MSITKLLDDWMTAVGANQHVRQRRIEYPDGSVLHIFELRMIYGDANDPMQYSPQAAEAAKWIQENCGGKVKWHDRLAAGYQRVQFHDMADAALFKMMFL